MRNKVEATWITPATVAAISAVRQILEKIREWPDQAVKHIGLFYSQTCTPTRPNILPIDEQRLNHQTQRPWPNRVLPTLRLETEPLLAALIRQHRFVSLFRACAESLSSKRLMRLKTTQISQRNIQESHDELVAEFHTRRQDTIDLELLEIGAEFEAIQAIE